MYCRLRNDDVVRHFVYRLEDARNHGRTLTCEGNKLFSYNTCIAQWNYGTLIINDTHYSRTTSRIMSYLRNHINTRYGGEYSRVKPEDIIVSVSGVLQGSQDLTSYLPEP